MPAKKSVKKKAKPTKRRDPAYMRRLVAAFTALLTREVRTSLTKKAAADRLTVILGRPVQSQVVGRWLGGSTQPGGEDEKRAFAQFLGVPWLWLFFDEGEMERPADARGAGVTHPAEAPAEAAQLQVVRGGGKNGGGR